MKKDKKVIIILLFILTFIFMVIGTTFAYFTMLQTAFYTPEAEVGSATTSTLMFNAGNPISIYATQSNFAPNMASLSDETESTVNLKAGSNGQEAIFNYNVKLNISENSFIYSTTNNSPELLITVIDPTGKEVKEVNGLEYKTVGNVSGFDVTDKQGTFSLATNYEIKTTSEIKHQWKVKVTFVNFDQNQNSNLSKKIEGNILLENV